MFAGQAWMRRYLKVPCSMRFRAIMLSVLLIFVFTYLHGKLRPVDLQFLEVIIRFFKRNHTVVE